jgi:uncharacterized protein (TIGR02996 family)
MPETLSPPRPELISLLDAIKDNPDEDTPRLVLADWLEENGGRFDAARARFIRRHIAEARGLQRPPVSEEARLYRADLHYHWLKPVRDFRSGWSFERGLPQLTVPCPRFFKPDVPALLATEAFAFVQLVNLEKADGSQMEAIAAIPEFCFVPGVCLALDCVFSTDSAARFFASPNLTGLRRLESRREQPGTVGMEALAKNPALSRLRKLYLYHNKLIDKAVAVLAETKHLMSLTHLNLYGNNISDEGAESLIASAALASLHELDLCLNPRLTDRGKQLLRDKFGDRVKLD